VNFAGDCVYFLQRHFTDCLLSGAEFESSGFDYLKTIDAVEAAYESARLGQVVRLG
jgi:predicted dehydrogenase